MRIRPQILFVPSIEVLPCIPNHAEMPPRPYPHSSKGPGEDSPTRTNREATTLSMNGTLQIHWKQSLKDQRALRNDKKCNPVPKSLGVANVSSGGIFNAMKTVSWKNLFLSTQSLAIISSVAAISQTSLPGLLVQRTWGLKQINLRLELPSTEWCSMKTGHLIKTPVVVELNLATLVSHPSKRPGSSMLQDTEIHCLLSVYKPRIRDPRYLKRHNAFPDVQMSTWPCCLMALGLLHVWYSIDNPSLGPGTLTTNSKPSSQKQELQNFMELPVIPILMT